MSSKAQIPSHFRDWNESSDPSIEAPKKSPLKGIFRKHPWYIGIAIAVVVIIIIAIAVPLAIILPKKGNKNPHTAILLPLYIYPKDNSTWAPLYNSLLEHPKLNITVIINPSSGPGKSDSPDEQYAAALNQLATYPNVRRVGYVRTGYASRNLSDVVDEIKIYSTWALKNPAFAMDGIFFDESPHQYSADAVDFMLRASSSVKGADGFHGSKMVVRNPGVVPDARFGDANTDVTVVFEQSYVEYQTKEAELATLKDSRSAHCYMIHSVPDMDMGGLRNLVNGLSKRAEYLFVTSNQEDYYESFGKDWAEFTESVLL